ncbi:hypothetical protein Syun_014632 [Stephania yunnanensis]|uniref:Uncharacterized protein n=1 Tax=Stephania yunnanensis TaxID=152371 RepID=A0AAP0JM20_9MAGN
MHILPPNIKRGSLSMRQNSFPTYKAGRIEDALVVVQEEEAAVLMAYVPHGWENETHSDSSESEHENPPKTPDDTTRILIDENDTDLLKQIFSQAAEMITLIQTERATPIQSAELAANQNKDLSQGEATKIQLGFRVAMVELTEGREEIRWHAWSGGCGSPNELYGSNCKHMTLCTTRGRKMAENRDKCYDCGAPLTRLIKYLHVVSSWKEICFLIPKECRKQNHSADSVAPSVDDWFFDRVEVSAIDYPYPYRWLGYQQLRREFPNLYQFTKKPKAKVAQMWSEAGWNLFPRRRRMSDLEIAEFTLLSSRLEGARITTERRDHKRWIADPSGTYYVYSGAV